MSVIAVGNQIDCTHRPSKCLYCHIQQTSLFSKITKVLSKYRMGEQEQCNNNYIQSFAIIIL